MTVMADNSTLQTKKKAALFGQPSVLQKSVSGNFCVICVPNVSEHVLNGSEHVLNDLVHVLNGLEHVLNSPEHVLKSLEHVLNDPEHVLNGLEHVLNDPERVLDGLEHHRKLCEGVPNRSKQLKTSDTPAHPIFLLSIDDFGVAISPPPLFC